MHSFCRTAWVCSFFFRLLWKWDNFMAAPISADKWNYLLTHLLLILWKKERLQGTINSRNRKGEGSYTKSKGNAIQHDRYVVRCNSLQMLEVFSIEVGIKCPFSEGKEEHMLQFLTWDVGWCQGLVRHLQWTDMLLTFEEHWYLWEWNECFLDKCKAHSSEPFPAGIQPLKVPFLQLCFGGTCVRFCTSSVHFWIP